ncbi:hypothetical protein L596_017968 [Steinernema carpocapsae]|uniref:Uncharacterized protein n=1 Tax=Steinernema carpocapsae TaxID=34508 RepID=A0A4U5N384_STECR|nr:hypothetical protein L596_017968 [Steinernema carpocapsae]
MMFSTQIVIGLLLIATGFVQGTSGESVLTTPVDSTSGVVQSSTPMTTPSNATDLANATEAVTKTIADATTTNPVTTTEAWTTASTLRPLPEVCLDTDDHNIIFFDVVNTQCIYRYFCSGEIFGPESKEDSKDQLLPVNVTENCIRQEFEKIRAKISALRGGANAQTNKVVVLTTLERDPTLVFCFVAKWPFTKTSEPINGVKELNWTGIEWPHGDLLISRADETFVFRAGRHYYSVSMKNDACGEINNVSLTSDNYWKLFMDRQHDIAKELPDDRKLGTFGSMVGLNASLVFTEIEVLGLAQIYNPLDVRAQIFHTNVAAAYDGNWYGEAQEMAEALAVKEIPEPASQGKMQQKFLRINAWLLLVAYYFLLTQLGAAIYYLQKRHIQVYILNVPVNSKGRCTAEGVSEETEAEK